MLHLLPLGQAKQSSSESPPSDGLYVPTGHNLHFPCPILSCYVPFLQILQTLNPSSSL